MLREENDRRRAIDAEVGAVYSQEPTRRDVVQPGDPSAEQMQRYDAENAATAAEDARTFGVQADPSGYRYGTPRTAETVARYGISGVEADTPEAARDAAVERVLMKHGKIDEAAGLKKTRIATRAAELGLKKAERDNKQAESIDAFDSHLAELAKTSGGIPGTQEIMQAASKAGVGMDVVHDRMTKAIGVSKEMAAQVAAQRKRELFDAMAKGQDAMLALYDPDKNDDNIPEIVDAGNGKFKLMYGGKPMLGDYTFADHNELGGYMAAIIDKDPVAYVYALEEQKLKRAKTLSEVDENKASAESSRAQAAKYGAERQQTLVETDRIGRGLGKGDAAPKVEGSEVALALGTPVIDEYSKTGAPMTDAWGKPIVTRNLAEERRFYQWMKNNGITDTNAGLLRWLGGENGQAGGAAKPKPKPAKPFDAAAFFKG